MPSKRRALKKTAIPSCNLPQVIVNGNKIEKDQRRSERSRRRDVLKDVSENEKQGQTEEERRHEDYTDKIKEFSPNEEIEALELSAEIEKEMVANVSSYNDVGVQVKSGDLLPRFMDFIHNDGELSSSTGIESIRVLNCIVKLASVVESEKGKNDWNGKMSLHDRIVMTYVKLKQNVSYCFLAVLFHCYTSKHCSRVFEEMIVLLSTCLKVAIPWPSREEISRNLPTCFSDFKNVRVVVDCTEIYIQNPSKLCCQLLTYSHYKSSQTIKFMTGVTPAGNVSYISKAYGGRASDKAIFEQSELVTLLEAGDEIMVDRGFLIEDICKLNNFKLVRPPFLKGQNQFSKPDAVVTADIAAARVHVERSNQRIKNFKMISDTMPSNLIPLVEHIFTVICGTVNLCSPIMNDNKFMENEGKL